MKQSNIPLWWCFREGNDIPLQYSCLENPMDGGAWQATVHGVAKSRTWLSDFTFTFHFHALEKEMATHSSVLAWRIPEMAEPGGLPSMGSHRVGHDWSNLAASTFPITIYWRDYPLPTVCFWYPCQRLVNSICIGLLLGSLFCSIGLYACFYTSTIKIWNTM